MRAVIGKSKAEGNVFVPPSKSISHRMLINAALCDGFCQIENIPLNGDIAATADCLRVLGAQICRNDNGFCTVRGIGAGKNTETALRRLDCKESASTLRFLLPLCLLDGMKTEFTGSRRLFERPMSVYRDICRENGILWEQDEEKITVCGRLNAGTYSIRADISSQFVSGLLFALSMPEKDSIIMLNNTVGSRRYIDMTINSLALFGVEAEWISENKIFIKGGRKRRAPDRVIRIEGDESSASFFGALNFTGGNVVINGLSENTVQPDREWRTLFEQVSAGMCRISLCGCPDLGPVLMVLGALCHGAVLTGTRRLGYKESDRANAMAQELRRCGIVCEVGSDSVKILPCKKITPPQDALDGHGDHRVIMALAVFLSTVGGTINGAEAVGKSLPEFWEMLKSIGIDVETY